MMLLNSSFSSAFLAFWFKADMWLLTCKKYTGLISCPNPQKKEKYGHSWSRVDWIFFFFLTENSWLSRHAFTNHQTQPHTRRDATSFSVSSVKWWMICWLVSWSVGLKACQQVCTSVHQSVDHRCRLILPSLASWWMTCVSKSALWTPVFLKAPALRFSSQ